MLCSIFALNIVLPFYPSCLLGEKNSSAPEGFPFPRRLAVRVTEVLAAQSHTHCSLLNTAVTRGQVCSFSCHSAQIPSLSANSNKQFWHMFVLGGKKKKNCHSATALSCHSSKYSLISGPFRQTLSSTQLQSNFRTTLFQMIL